MANEIVNWLRALSDECEEWWDSGDNIQGPLIAAADLIEAQQAEIERLRTELDAERAIADKLAFDFRRHLAWYGTKETHKSLAAHKEARRG